MAMRGIAGLVALALVTLAMAALAETVREEDLPGSPDGRYQVHQSGAQQDNGGWRYRITMFDRTTGISTLLYEHERHVEIAWAPTSDRLALTDFTGSNTIVKLGDRRSVIPMHGGKKQLGTGLMERIKKDLGIK